MKWVWETAGLMPGMLVIAALTITSMHAGPVLNDPETWDSGLSGWVNTTEDAALSNPDGYLRIAFGQQSGVPEFEEDTIFTQDPDRTGDFQINYLNLRFSFYAEDLLPVSSVLYLHAAGEPDTTYWQYSFSNTEVGAWTEHNISFVYSEGWTWSAGAGDANQFWNDLANIDWIGVNIARGLDTREQAYGLDNWEYYIVIPEPGNIFILVSAVLSLVFTYRKRQEFALAE